MTKNMIQTSGTGHGLSKRERMGIGPITGAQETLDQWHG
jgi:hypothetical protein